MRRTYMCTKKKKQSPSSEQVIISCSKRTNLVWGRGVIKDTTYLMNITDKILLALKFELTQKYSASKSQHCWINKKSDV